MFLETLLCARDRLHLITSAATRAHRIRHPSVVRELFRWCARTSEGDSTALFAITLHRHDSRCVGTSAPRPSSLPIVLAGSSQRFGAVSDHTSYQPAEMSSANSLSSRRGWQPLKPCLRPAPDLDHAPDGPRSRSRFHRGTSPLFECPLKGPPNATGAAIHRGRTRRTRTRASDSRPTAGECSAAA